VFRGANLASKGGGPIRLPNAYYHLLPGGPLPWDAFENSTRGWSVAVLHMEVSYERKTEYPLGGVVERTPEVKTFCYVGNPIERT